MIRRLEETFQECEGGDLVPVPVPLFPYCAPCMEHVYSDFAWNLPHIFSSKMYIGKYSRHGASGIVTKPSSYSVTIVTTISCIHQVHHRIIIFVILIFLSVTCWIKKQKGSKSSCCTNSIDPDLLYAEVSELLRQSVSLRKHSRCKCHIFSLALEGHFHHL